MKKIVEFFKKDITFTVSGLLCIISVFIVSPDNEYISYINFSVLSLLFCLMVVVSGFEKSGLFDVLKYSLTKYIKTEKSLIFALTMLCFFTSSLITNDVALITFVPFSMALLKRQKQSSVIFCVVMETIAANLGSLLTPIGNPQNLFIYTYYNLSIAEFFKTTLPLGAICLLMIFVCFIFIKNDILVISDMNENNSTDKKYITIFSLLFLLCILCILKVVSYTLTFLIVLIVIFITDKKIFKNADYILLITFIFFFIFSGNIKRIPFIYDFIRGTLNLNETLVISLICQFISNVPAATMLSSFTDNYNSMILGTNIGGLGTLIASMASLISYRYISREKNISSLKYIFIFSIYNFLMLIILLLIYCL